MSRRVSDAAARNWSTSAASPAARELRKLASQVQVAVVVAELHSHCSKRLFDLVHARGHHRWPVRPLLDHRRAAAVAEDRRPHGLGSVIADHGRHQETAHALRRHD